MQVEGIMALVIPGVSVQALDRITGLSRIVGSTAARLTMLFDLLEICWSVSTVFIIIIIIIVRNQSFNNQVDELQWCNFAYIITYVQFITVSKLNNSNRHRCRHRHHHHHHDHSFVE